MGLIRSRSYQISIWFYNFDRVFREAIELFPLQSGVEWGHAARKVETSQSLQQTCKPQKS